MSNALTAGPRYPPYPFYQHQEVWVEFISKTYLSPTEENGTEVAMPLTDSHINEGE